jgi:hypothetical protein
VTLQKDLTDGSTGMPAHCVEEMVGEEVVLSHDVVAPTPMSAAVAATQRLVAFRTDQEEWIRVLDAASGCSFVFAYVGADRRSTIDKQIVEVAKKWREQKGQKPLGKKNR